MGIHASYHLIDCLVLVANFRARGHHIPNPRRARIVAFSYRAEGVSIRHYAYIE
jgi:hypothetical protein